MGQHQLWSLNLLNVYLAKKSKKKDPQRPGKKTGDQNKEKEEKTYAAGLF